MLSHVHVRWWESPSLLTQINTVAAVLAAIIPIWAAFYASRPRRGLSYDAAMRPPRRNEAVWVNTVVPEPEQSRAVIIKFGLRGIGRLDVPSSLFDSATPITLSFKDAEIRDVAPVEMRRGGGLAPPMQLRDGKLEIGPGLIGRHQHLTYTLLAVTKPRSSWWMEAKKEMYWSGPLWPQRIAVRATLTNALVDTRLRTVGTESLIQLSVVGILIVVFYAMWEAWLRHITIHVHISPLTLILTILAVLLAVLVFSPNTNVPSVRRRGQQQVKFLEDRPPPED